jgi:membrane protease YdiL (CAAX protease family)
MATGPFWLAWAVYLPMAALAALWAYATRGAVFSLAAPPWLSSERGLAAGLGVGLALLVAVTTIASTRVLVARTVWARELHLTLRAALLGMPSGRVAQLAVLSSVSEELLFRAALQPAAGLVGSSLLFGLLHVSPRGTYVAWALWATLMGFLFGALYLASGTLLAPILAHALINYENMQYIIHYDPTPLDKGRLGRDANCP